MAAAPTPPPPSLRQQIGAGVRDSVPAGLGMYPIGIAFGVLVIQAGLPWWIAPAFSTAGFAGSLELLLIGLVTVATPLAVIALTTLLVNVRHVFYAFSFPLHVVRNPVARVYSMYALIDEAYAVTAARRTGWTGPRLLAMQLAFQLYWVGGGLTGVLLARLVPVKVAGLDFALCALFITLTLDGCRTRHDVPSLVLGGLSIAVALVVTPGEALFVGLGLFVLALVVRYALLRRRGRRGRRGIDSGAAARVEEATRA